VGKVSANKDFRASNDALLGEHRESDAAFSSVRQIPRTLRCSDQLRLRALVDCNPLAASALSRCAVASAGAIFVMMELYHPFGGFIENPKHDNAFAQRGS